MSLNLREQMPSVLNREQALGLIHSSELSAPSQALVTSLLAPTILIQRERTDAPIPLGASRIGGDPDLPIFGRWPSYERLPMMFVAQINLGEVAASVPMESLPSAGQLYLFADVQSGDMEPECFQFIASKGRWLRRCAGPPWETEKLPPCRLTFHPSWDLPDARDPMIAGTALAGTEAEAYQSLLQRIRGGDEHYRHQLLGYPRSVQPTTREEVNAYRFHRRDGEAPALSVEQARRWQVLLQLDSDEGPDGPEISWGDLGTLTVWTFEDDLKKRRLRRSILIPSSF